MASPGTSDWRGPIEITWRDSVHMPCIPIHCTSMDGWFVLKSIAHGCKCPIELYVPIDVGRKFSWLMKTCSEFSLHLRDAINTNISYLEIFVVLLEVAVKLFTRTWFRILISVRLCFWEYRRAIAHSIATPTGEWRTLYRIGKLSAWCSWSQVSAFQHYRIYMGKLGNQHLVACQ